MHYCNSSLVFKYFQMWVGVLMRFLMDCPMNHNPYLCHSNQQVTWIWMSKRNVGTDCLTWHLFPLVGLPEWKICPNHKSWRVKTIRWLRNPFSLNKPKVNYHLMMNLLLHHCSKNKVVVRSSHHQHQDQLQSNNQCMQEQSIGMNTASSIPFHHIYHFMDSLLLLIFRPHHGGCIHLGG